MRARRRAIGAGNPLICGCKLVERPFRRTQWGSDAAGAVHGGLHRDTLWKAANTSVSRAHVGRGAIAIGIGDTSPSLNASGGAVRLGFATQMSRWMRQVALCRWESGSLSSW